MTVLQIHSGSRKKNSNIMILVSLHWKKNFLIASEFVGWFFYLWLMFVVFLISVITASSIRSIHFQWFESEKIHLQSNFFILDYFVCEIYELVHHLSLSHTHTPSIYTLPEKELKEWKKKKMKITLLKALK
jgi:hypothetical protein